MNLLTPCSSSAGVNLLVLWILGEYIGRLYEEVKGRPIYVVRHPQPPSAEPPRSESAEAERADAVSDGLRSRSGPRAPLHNVLTDIPWRLPLGSAPSFVTGRLSRVAAVGHSVGVSAPRINGLLAGYLPIRIVGLVIEAAFTVDAVPVNVSPFTRELGTEVVSGYGRLTGEMRVVDERVRYASDLVRFRTAHDVGKLLVRAALRADRGDLARRRIRARLP